MARYSIRIKDRQRGKTTTVYIEANNSNEAKAIAMRDYGVAYEILG